jgi:uncharacterized protein YqiB (DUF1249 family)
MAIENQSAVPHQNSAKLDVIRVTRYTTSLYVIHFKCALNFGEAQLTLGIAVALFIHEAGAKRH